MVVWMRRNTSPVRTRMWNAAFSSLPQFRVQLSALLTRNAQFTIVTLRLQTYSALASFTPLSKSHFNRQIGTYSALYTELVLLALTAWQIWASVSA